MIFDMKLRDLPYNQLLNGEKTVELRLYDGKRKQIHVDDIVRFTHIKRKECYIYAKVVALHIFPDFKSLFLTELYEKCGCAGYTMEEAVEAYATQHPDWDKVVLVPVTTITDANKNIVSFRHDFKLNSAKLVGNKDKIDIKVITSKFNQ